MHDLPVSWTKVIFRVLARFQPSTNSYIRSVCSAEMLCFIDGGVALQIQVMHHLHPTIHPTISSERGPSLTSTSSDRNKDRDGSQQWRWILNFLHWCAINVTFLSVCFSNTTFIAASRATSPKPLVDASPHIFIAFKTSNHHPTVP